MIRLWRALLASPRGGRLARRFERQIRFLENRLSPEGYLGLRLTFGALALIAGVWLFGAIAEDVVSNDPLTLLDREVALRFHEHATPQRGAFRCWSHTSSLRPRPVNVQEYRPIELFYIE